MKSGVQILFKFKKKQETDKNKESDYRAAFQPYYHYGSTVDGIILCFNLSTFRITDHTG